ncbi:hypothetical protein [Solimonas soli]|uniref:hypothetical protein n=1 Tax=Solimonas soli TaxID=413479 RepID=UPI0004868AE2|nr:hypothetical protein [Solimonas soli]
MPATYRARAAAALAALALAACASRPLAPAPADAAAGAPPAVLAPALWNENFDAGLGELGLRLGGSAPLEGAMPLFDSDLSFAGLERRLQYSAGYEVDPGDLLNPDAASRWRADTLPQTVSSQTVSQRLQLKLDELAGAPLTVGAQYRQQEALQVAGTTASAQQAMDLRWAPSFAAVHLNWMPEGAPVDTTQALRCDRSGQISVPLTAQGDAPGRYVSVDARTRLCRVAAGDDPALAELTANTWSTGLRWGRASRETALRLQSVTPGPGANVIESDRPLTAGSGYELRLSQQRQLGDWQAKAGLAWRRPPEALHPAFELPEASPWATSAELQRRLGAANVAASWQRGDAYWFLPNVRAPADTFALSVDFSPWAVDGLGRYTPTMAMSYSWMRSDNQSVRDDQQSLNWNLSFPWR